MLSDEDRDRLDRLRAEGLLDEDEHADFREVAAAEAAAGDATGPAAEPDTGAAWSPFGTLDPERALRYRWLLWAGLGVAVLFGVVVLLLGA